MKPRSIAAFVRALQILAKYEDEGMDSAYFLEADHDIIYSHLHDTCNVSKEDAKELIALGWHFDDSVDVWAYNT